MMQGHSFDKVQRQAQWQMQQQLKEAQQKLKAKSLAVSFSKMAHSARLHS